METSVSKFLLLSALLEVIYQPASTFGCALFKSNDQPCGHKIKGSLGLAKEAFKQLFAIIKDTHRVFDEDDDTFNTLLTQFVESCVCQNRHEHKREHARSQWRKELYDQEKRSRLRQELETILSKSLEEPIHSTPLSSKFKLRVSGTPASPEEDVALKVAEKAYETLTEQDSESGRLYLFSLSGQEDMFKVGKTIDMKNRFSCHRRCYGDITILRHAFLPFVRRIEQLILTELSQKHCELSAKCKNCDTAHREWIQIGRADMETVFDKWVEFARGENEPALRETEAYDKDGNFNSKYVVLPPPAGNYKFLLSTSLKKSRRSTGGSSQSSPSKPGPARSDINFIGERISVMSLGDSQPGKDDSGEDDGRGHISSLTTSLLAARRK
ncbi:uncharacterized protein N7511_010201 [Penicillium nucicola]|uniref:uncharacterized protein n=1 Tax=Penicillium nucicola TaxID=1850975 RepID=UPI002545A0CF|nr:uncharacterized protein N7511_010201 [Penicillium nucicola]KAJ5748505.1 hypothetical protein N7511_010201 [Penicillium nucicola]